MVEITSKDSRNELNSLHYPIHEKLGVLQGKFSKFCKVSSGQPGAAPGWPLPYDMELPMACECLLLILCSLPCWKNLGQQSECKLWLSKPPKCFWKTPPAQVALVP